MPTFKAPREVVEMLAKVCEDNYPELSELKLRVGCLFAVAATNDKGMKTGPGLKRNGYPADWTAKVTSVDQRLTGSPDVLLKIDGDSWNDVWSYDQQVAVLDEFLFAISVQRDPETDDPLGDDAGRPSVKLKKFDIYVQGFEQIIRRHGESSLCRRALNRVEERLSQKTMGWD